VATYAVGDIQGCFDTLQRLLRRICFRPEVDRLWLVGDLVNRGPRSLEVLRWARGLGAAASVVLGNHDLHLLARAAGVAPARRRDTLDPVLAADDRETLLDWVRARPLLHREGDRVLVHAGLLPRWSVEDAEELARGAEGALRGADWAGFLRKVGTGAGGGPAARGESLASAAAVLTSVRVCRPDGSADEGYTGRPGDAPEGLLPWFDVPGRRSAGNTVVFGHWAALGLRNEPEVVALDTGCVWGGALTAVRLEDRRVFQEPSSEGPARRSGG
jgi:bis(5'-nucleosyl)-tetraphosphatase (symmetrical)